MSTKPKVTMPGRKAPPESAVRALEAAAEARQNRPAKSDVASSQARPTASPQAEAPTPPSTTDDRAVIRKRGAWTKDRPYQRKDGTATRGTTVYLPVELAERLRRFAFERDTKQNAIMTEAIAAFLDTKGA